MRRNVFKDYYNKIPWKALLCVHNGWLNRNLQMQIQYSIHYTLYSTVQYTLYSTVQYTLYSTVQYKLYSTVQYIYSTVQYRYVTDCCIKKTQLGTKCSCSTVVENKHLVNQRGCLQLWCSTILSPVFNPFFYWKY